MVHDLTTNSDQKILGSAHFYGLVRGIFYYFWPNLVLYFLFIHYSFLSRYLSSDSQSDTYLLVTIKLHNGPIWWFSVTTCGLCVNWQTNMVCAEGCKLPKTIVSVWHYFTSDKKRLWSGWSEPLLVAHDTLLEISCCGSIIYRWFTIRCISIGNNKVAQRSYMVVLMSPSPTGVPLCQLSDQYGLCWIL